MKFWKNGAKWGTRTMLVSAAKNKKILRAEREARARKASKSNPDNHIFLSLLQHSSYLAPYLGLMSTNITSKEMRRIMKLSLVNFVTGLIAKRSIDKAWRRFSTRIPDTPTTDDDDRRVGDDNVDDDSGWELAA